jgi:F0F1-type ATP synthase assembly protein I
MLLTIPALLIISPLLGGWFGFLLDRRFKTSPWLLIAGLLLGFAAAGRETYLIYRRSQEEENAGRK